MLKSPAELKKLPANSTDVFKSGAIEYYQSRPNEMKHICLADFVAMYNFKGKGKQSDLDNEDLEMDESILEDENVDPNISEEVLKEFPKKVSLKCGTFTLRKKPKVLRFCRFDINKDRSNFFRERIMLFKPWTNEIDEVENVHHEQVYNQHKNIITANAKKYIALDIDIESILNEITQQQQEEENMELYDNEASSNFLNVYDYDEESVRPDMNIDFGDDRVNSIEAKKYKVPDMYTDKDYFDLCDSLNNKQRDYLMHILNCFKLNEEPLYHFISGSAGVGKSRLIKAVYQSLIREFRKEPGDAGFPEVLIVACTGKAAHNVGGMTAHHAFHLPMVDRSTSESFKGLGPEILNTCRVTLSKLRLIIIDEISMMGTSMFEKIHLRLNQIFGNQDQSKIFGNKSVIVLGDFNQLKPVCDDFVFMPSKKNILNQIAGSPLWNKFLMFELTEIMRQRDDKVFAEALNRLSQGTLTTDDVTMFCTRVFNESDLPDAGKSAIRLMFSNKEVDSYNEKRAKDQRKPGTNFIVSNAIDSVTGATNETEIRQALHNVKSLHYTKTQGLSKDLILQEFMRYMVTSNIDVDDGLFNGATGVLRLILYNVNRQPTTVFIEFDDPMIGKKSREKYSTIIQNNSAIQATWTPISKTKLSFTTTRKQNVKVRFNK